MFYPESLPNNSEQKTYYMSKDLSLMSNEQRVFKEENISNHNYFDIKTKKFNEELNDIKNTELTKKLCECEIKECFCSICNNFPCKCLEIKYKKAEKEFLNYLMECIKIENEIEKSKKNLCLKYEFNIEDIFKIFDKENKNFISDDDLIKGLKLFDIYLSEKELKLIKRRLKKRSLENINYSDFFDLLVPYEKKIRNILENRIGGKFIPENNKTDIFLLSTKNTFTNLIKLIVSLENQIDNLRKNLKFVQNEIKNIFYNIDKGKLGNINDVDLNNFFRIKGIKINNYDSCLLFIRIDKDKNGKIQFWELMNEFEITK